MENETKPKRNETKFKLHPLPNPHGTSTIKSPVHSHQKKYKAHSHLIISIIAAKLRQTFLSILTAITMKITSFFAGAICFATAVLSAVFSVAVIGTTVGTVGFTYGFAYFQLFPQEEFNVCELKKKHLHDENNYFHPWLLPLAQHFWNSPHAPVCIDDIPKPVAPTITKDVIQQLGWQNHVQSVIEYVPAFVSRRFDVLSSVDQLYSETDRLLDPLLKKTSWYDSFVEKETELPPTHASFSFQDYVRWSVDYVFETTFVRDLPTVEQVQSVLPDNIFSAVGTHFFYILDATREIIETFPSVSLRDVLLPSWIFNAHNMHTWAFNIYEASVKLANVADSFRNLRLADALTLDQVQWLFKLFGNCFLGAVHFVGPIKVIRFVLLVIGYVFFVWMEARNADFEAYTAKQAQKRAFDQERTRLKQGLKQRNLSGHVKSSEQTTFEEFTKRL